MGYKEKLKIEKKNRLESNNRYADISPSLADDSVRKIISDEKSIEEQDQNNCSDDTV